MFYSHQNAANNLKSAKRGSKSSPKGYEKQYQKVLKTCKLKVCRFFCWHQNTILYPSAILNWAVCRIFISKD
jgi:hypothetical protein